MNTYPLHSLSLEEAMKLQFKVVDCITKEFEGHEILTRGDLGVVMGLNKPVTTAKAETVSYTHLNMAYARGAVGRIQLVESGTYQFAVCSQYAAENAIEEGREIEIALNFGPGSFLSRHVLILGEKFSSGIQDGMRVAYDRDSLDQKGITENLIRGKKVWLVDIRVQQTLSAIEDGVCLLYTSRCV